AGIGGKRKAPRRLPASRTPALLDRLCRDDHLVAWIADLDGFPDRDGRIARSGDAVVHRDGGLGARIDRVWLHMDPAQLDARRGARLPALEVVLGLGTLRTLGRELGELDGPPARDRTGGGAEGDCSRIAAARRGPDGRTGQGADAGARELLLAVGG